MGGVPFRCRCCLAVIICSVGAAVLTELVLEQLLRHRVTVSDLSAVWSGVTVGMLMPPSVSFWVPMLASAVGIGVFKCALGGRGRTVISPALGGFAVLTLLMPSRLGVFTAPFSRLSVFSSAGEGASYLLSSVPGASMPSESIGSLFLGIRPGTIGEVSALMLLIGLAYLMARGVLSWEAPLTFVGISALLFYIFPRYSLEDRFLAAELLCGLIPICALVFAPDFACSPRLFHRPARLRRFVRRADLRAALSRCWYLQRGVCDSCRTDFFASARLAVYSEVLRKHCRGTAVSYRG